MLRIEEKVEPRNRECLRGEREIRMPADWYVTTRDDAEMA